MRRDPEDDVTARTDSVGCQDADVNEIVLLGSDCIVCGVVWSILSACFMRKLLSRVRSTICNAGVV